MSIKIILQRIKDTRIQQKMTQREAAERLLMDQSVYCRHETGKCELTISFLQSVADMLDVPITYFFEADSFHFNRSNTRLAATKGDTTPAST
jgi:transcriptional regulator with XRE-family HTH domain